MTDISELVQRIKAAAEKASVGDWVQESGDGWDAICSNDDQANGGFIIAHFEGPDAAVNRNFVQSANPANILTLTAALEKAQARIAELENSETQLIQERDHAEAALSDMYQAATGERPEWSNMFGFADAVADVDERITAAGIKLESES